MDELNTKNHSRLPNLKFESWDGVQMLSIIGVKSLDENNSKEIMSKAAQF